MHQIIAILAAAVAVLTGGIPLRPLDATPPIGMIVHSAPPAITTQSTTTNRPIVRHPMDATPPIGM